MMEYILLLLLCSGIYLLVNLYQKLVQLHHSPLIKVPGPYVCKLTRSISLYYIFTGQIHIWMHDLHLKYGPVVQFSPHEISVISEEGVDAIYSTYKFQKTPFYKAIEFGGPNISSIRDREYHTTRKKIMAKIFSIKNLVNLEQLFNNQAIDPLLTKLSEHAKSNKEFDFYELSIHGFFNFVGMFTFSEEFNFINTGGHPIKNWVKDSQIYSILSYQIPIVRFFGNLFGKHGFYALQQFCQKKINERQNEKTSDKKDVLNHLLNNNKFNPKEKLNNSEITGEITVQFLAGIEAPGITLAWLIKLLIKHPEVMNKLNHELDNVFPDRNEKIYIDKIDSQCSYLDAVVCETFRFYPVISGFIPRLVPKSGCNFSGHYIPEGVEVGLSGFAYHRSPLLWKDPDVFNPDRFMNDPQHHNKSLLMTFIKGPNSCLGREIGLMIINLTIATLLRRYNISMNPKKLNFDHNQYLALKSSDNRVLISISPRT